MDITACNIDSWVKDANEDQHEFRQAVQIILTAISNDLDLQKTMIMKGGILMAIRYKSHRFTKDLDFSSTLLREQLEIDEFKRRFSNSLANAVAESEYDLDCRIQRFHVEPPGKTASFLNLRLSIGYAYKGTPKHKKLLNTQSPTKIDIDFNLNERIFGIENLDLGQGTRIQAYVLTDLVAEKLRSLLQQPVRNRYRRQDTYDLRLLIESGISQEDRTEILHSLIAKARSRGIDPTPESLDDPEVRRRAERDYPTLADEVDEELPDFDESFELVLKFYRTLPWDSLTDH